MQRALIVLLLLFTSVGSATAQDASNKTPVIGWLSPATLQSYSQPGHDNPGPHQLRDALSKHGLIDGKNVRIDMRLAEGKLDRLPELAETAVQQGATVILAFGEAAGRAAAAATKTVPIVCVADDLVDSGLGISLARPGSNVTGVSILATELDAKKIELLKELLPGAKRFGVLNDPATGGSGRPRQIAETAHRVGVELQTIDIRASNDFGAAFLVFRSGRIEGINIVSSALLTSLRQQLAELSLAARIPAICQWRNMVEAGCLASYGVTLSDLYALSADQIARLLKGAK